MEKILTIEKINDYKYLIPRKEDMRVPGILYISEKLLDKAVSDNATSQVMNVAKLRGITGYSLAMPDVHWGYGAPIGGVGAFDAESGVIVPGFVGYDINCLPEDAKILFNHGYSFSIKECETRVTELSCFNSKKIAKEETTIAIFIKKWIDEEIFIIKTNAGYEIKATEEHPLWTENGKTEIRDIAIGDKIVIYPFKGIPYEEPKDSVILSEEDFTRNAEKNFGKREKGNALEQIKKILKEKGLLPLKYTSIHMPEILKLMGYLFGDGSISFNKNNGYLCTSFFGRLDDMIEIEKDIRKIGFSPYTCNRKRKHHIVTEYSTYDFETTTATCKTASRSLALLMASLGVPVGNKTSQDFNIPYWIHKAPLWQKRLFIASFFGAEISSPKIFVKHGYNFYLPSLSMNKNIENTQNGIEFMNELSLILREFGVKTNKISVRKEKIGKERNEKIRIRLLISNKTESMLNLCEKIGIEYNRDKSFLSNVAAFYLRKKIAVLREREEVAVSSRVLKNQGFTLDEIHTQIGSDFVNKRFIERSLYENRKTQPRISHAFAEFREYKTLAEETFNKSGFVLDEVSEIKKIPYTGFVYDFTVTHPDHNFIANNILVSNCGVRLIRSNLTVEDVRDKLEDITNLLFTNIPSGVGSTGKLKLKIKELEKVAAEGAVWAVKNGFGTQGDLENIEEYGRLKDADPDAVSNKAYGRGQEQLGTLGSGNHFLEIQQVVNVYDEKTAGVFGIFPGQITVMVHTGSRGFGYQVCDDYLDKFGRVAAEYGLQLPDRQLACAPASSKEGRRYFKAMNAAANYAFANRQLITHWVREVFSAVFGTSWEKMQLSLVYDVTHNICKIEKHSVEGREKLLYIHRKGATRAFPKGHPELPDRYKHTGHPVIIPGTMGTCSYVLVGTEKAMEETWGSTSHGAGRTMSRHQAIKENRNRAIAAELALQGILVKGVSRKGLVEEMPEAYKDIDEVIKVVEGAGLCRKIARMIPLAVIKG